jgi:hypothetical protein
LTVAKQTIANFIEKASRLYEQKRSAACVATALEMVISSALARCARGPMTTKVVVCGTQTCSCTQPHRADCVVLFYTAGGIRRVRHPECWGCTSDQEDEAYTASKKDRLVSLPTARVPGQPKQPPGTPRHSKPREARGHTLGWLRYGDESVPWDGSSERDETGIPQRKAYYQEPRLTRRSTLSMVRPPWMNTGTLLHRE